MTQEYQLAQKALADLKTAVLLLLRRAPQEGFTNAEIGRRLGIYNGHQGHQGHISRTVLALLEQEGAAEQDQKTKRWRAVFPGSPKTAGIRERSHHPWFADLTVGEEYTRPDLAEIWGYQSHHAIGRGIITPASQELIILFVTIEKQDHQTQYDDKLVGHHLFMEGEKEHQNDQRLVRAETNGEQIHLFFRDRHHQPFIYKGRVRLEKFELKEDQPSQFEFLLLDQ